MIDLSVPMKTRSNIKATNKLSKKLRSSGNLKRTGVTQIAAVIGMQNRPSPECSNARRVDRGILRPISCTFTDTHLSSSSSATRTPDFGVGDCVWLGDGSIDGSDNGRDGLAWRIFLPFCLRRKSQCPSTTLFLQQAEVLRMEERVCPEREPFLAWRARLSAVGEAEGGHGGCCRAFKRAVTNAGPRGAPHPPFSDLSNSPALGRSDHTSGTGHPSRPPVLF